MPRINTLQWQCHAPLSPTPKKPPHTGRTGNLWHTTATGLQTSNIFTILDQVVTSGGESGPCTHNHTQDDGLYVVREKCTFNAGGRDGMPAPSMAFVAISHLTEYSFTVDEASTQPLNFYLPAGFEIRFRHETTMQLSSRA